MEHLGHMIYLGGSVVQTIHFGYQSLAIQILGESNCLIRKLARWAFMLQESIDSSQGIMFIYI
jgi:hypothetical protein